MADPYLTITSVGGTIQSNEIASTGVGVEVKAGMTGLGLPPVELQFDQSAGDGARFRGARMQQRSLDVNIQVYGPNRESLTETLDRISVVLAHPCTVTWVDPDANKSWRVTAYRSGGGDYAYGVDGNGATTCLLDLTMQTESPFWESAQLTTVNIISEGTADVNNDGTKEAVPTWKITGPTLGFSLTNADGDKLKFSGLIRPGVTVTVNAADGTVTDNNGYNRYGQLSGLPRFWHVPIGSSVPITVDWDNSSTDFETAYLTPKKNFVLNPAITSATNWSTTGGYFYEAGNMVCRPNGGTILTANRPKTETPITGLTPGETYSVTVRMTVDETVTYPSSATRFRPVIGVQDGDILKSANHLATSPQDISFNFRADKANVTLIIYADCAYAAGVGYYLGNTSVDRAYVGHPGTYFSGSSTDTADWDYSWSGTTDNSVSLATPVRTSAAAATETKVVLQYRKRKWLMI